MIRSFTVSFVLALACAPVSAQTGAGNLSTAEVIQRVEQSGYSDVRDVEFDDGLWEVTATNAHGDKVELLVDPQSGEVRDPRAAPALSAADVAARLQAQGYADVRDIEYDDGRYEVEATNARGERVDLKVDPRDGRILREKVDD